jgi:hypothetical protein
MRYFLLPAFLAAFLLALLASAIYSSVRTSQACEARGGRMVHDGTFTYIWQVTDYKTGMGVLVPYPNMTCSVPK